MRRLLRFLRDSGTPAGRFALLAALSVASAACGIALPEILRQGVDRVSTLDLPGLIPIGAAALGLTLLTAGVEAALKLGKRRYLNSCEEGWQLRLAEKHVNIKRAVLHKWAAGEVITVLISNAMDGVSHSLAAALAFVTGCALLLFSAVYMGILSLPLTLCLLAYNALFRLASHHAERGIKRSAARMVEVNKENNSFLTSLLGNMLLVRVYGGTGFFRELLTRRERETLKAGLRRSAWGNGLMDGTWAFAKLAEFFLIYGLGGWLVLRGNMPIGNLIAFVFALDLFVKGIDCFANYLSDKNNAAAQIDSVEEFLSIRETEDEPLLPLPEEPFAVRLEDVSFRYGEAPLLEHITVTIHPGDKVLIKGPNGQGKSTLLKVIAGLYRPDSGRVLYGEAPASGCHLSGLSAVNSVISQHNELLEGTVPENIALSLAPDSQKVAGLLALLGLAHTRDTAPASLSQGEKQRLNIGRALYRERTLLVLGDEIFANVDHENARRIEEALAARWADLTVLLVAHEQMDFPFTRVLTVSDGRVAEEAPV